MNKTFCPVCKTDNPANAVYCCMCGKKLADLLVEQERLEAIRSGRIPVLEKQFHTESGMKKLRVICGNITNYPDEIDLLTVSAFKNRYYPKERTLLGSLYREKQISVADLAKAPFLDLRNQGSCWISNETGSSTIRRIGCVELSDVSRISDCKNEDYLPIVKTYFQLLDIAGGLGIKIRHIASPMLGTGNQGIDEKLIAYPLANEIISFLRRNPAAERFTFFDLNFEKACALAEIINTSYQIRQREQRPTGNRGKPFVFISYTTRGDQDTANLLCSILQEKGIDYWFAPRDIHSGAYAEAIFNAINKCTHFICLISKNSMRSPHVLNEIDLAFQHVKDGVQILPYRLDEQGFDLEPSFSYYLSRMQWNNGFPNPAETRAREFIEKAFATGKK